MNTFFKYLGISALAALTLASCQRYDPEERVITTVDLPRCLKPVQVKTEVKYNTVKIDLKVFPDAEKYILDIYKSDFDLNGEPLFEEDFVERLEIDPEDIPYSFKTLEDMTLYYRISSTNLTKKKEQSYWETGHFTTNVDPATICLTLEPELTECFELVRFDWAKQETDKYQIEVYNKAIPSTGEPAAENLVETINLTNEDMPFSKKFPVISGNYYYRAKAIDLAGVRRDSKWAKGSFKTEQYSWPVSEKAINEEFTDNYSEPDRSIIKSLFTGDSYVALDTVCYKKIYYMKDCQYFSDKMSTRGQAGKYTTEYGAEIPVDKRFIFFYICKPGTFSAILRKGDGGKGTVALLTTKKGFGKKCIYVFDSDQISSSKGNPTVLDITEEMLYGITEPAQVILFNSQKSKALQVYPISWTPKTTE